MSRSSTDATVSALGPWARRSLIIVGALTIWAGLMWPYARGRFHLEDDLINFHVPLRAYYAECLQEGRDPRWCPGLYCGFDLHGEGQLGMAHPLHWMGYKYLGFSAAYALEFGLPYLFGWIGMAVFLRARGVSTEAALLGGTLFAFGGYNAAHYVHMNSVAVLAHAPWLLWATERFWRLERGGGGWGAALALLTGSQFLSGHPQTAWFSLMIEGSYVGLLLVTRPTARHRLTGWLAAKLLGFGIGAAQILPTKSALEGSFRVEPTPEFLGLFSLPWPNLIQWFAPYALPARIVAGELWLDGARVVTAADSLRDPRIKEYVIYVGCLSTVLITWALGRVRGLRPRGGLFVWGVGLLGGGLALALGSETPLFDWTVGVPVMNLFRVPARYVALLSVGAAILTAVAFDELMGMDQNKARRRGWLFAVPVAISAAVTCWLRFGSELDTIPRVALSGWPWFGVGLMAATAGLAAFAARGRRWALAALPAVFLADLAVYDWSYWNVVPPERFETVAEQRRLPPVAPGERVAIVPPRAIHNFGIFNGQGMVTGYVALIPDRRLDYQDPTVLRLASTRLRLGASMEVIEGPLPRARFVTQVRVSGDPMGDLGAIDPERVALVEALLPIEDGPCGSVAIQTDEPGFIRMNVQTPTRQFLVLSERFHSGWKATIDGRDHRVFRAYGDFMGVVVRPGDRQVELSFEPRSHVIGARISLGSALLAAAWFVFGRRPRRSRPAQETSSSSKSHPSRPTRARERAGLEVGLRDHQGGN